MKMKKNMGDKNIHSIIFVFIDILLIMAAEILPLFIRFDFSFLEIGDTYLQYIEQYSIANIIITIFIFACFRMYNTLWQYAAMPELQNIVYAVCISSTVSLLGIFLFVGRMPLSYIVLYPLCLGAFIGGERLLYRHVLIRLRESKFSTGGTRINTMIIGAGEAGKTLIREFKNSPETHNEVKCVIDDDERKQAKYIQGHQIFGGRDTILEAVEKYEIQEIVIAMPSASTREVRGILEICKETPCKLRILPGIYQLVNGDVHVSKLRDVQIEDLLGREPVRINMDEIGESIRGKVVLITGGGGSIGSELCRQIAGYEPKQLIIVDIYENNAYDIEQELRYRHPELNLTVLIASVRDSRRINRIFEQYRPEIVYHAAAHKHVPLMENSPCETIKNNVLGTYKTAYAAMAYGCSRFVLISTDKAVNPTNIMGASKRMCEMVIQAFDRKVKQKKTEEIPDLFSHEETVVSLKNAKTEFVAVRFGNVLGSNGSVIPLFKKQIAEGGPVTVTHPDIIRYFMTIPEAVSLVLQAGVYAKGGEIFVLDMGEPVKIDTLARNLIKLSGYEPDVDIMIKYTGLRPGEKLYEERLMAEEGLKKTENNLIHIGCPIPFEENQFFAELKDLMEQAYENREDIRQSVAKLVVTYQLER